MRSEHVAFRAWLVEKITQTKWATFDDEPLEQTAERLGVHPSILVEAQAALTKKMTEAGRMDVRLGSHARFERRKKIIDICVPEKVYTDFHEFVGIRQMNPSNMFRSLIHSLLAGPTNPSYVGPRWLYRGAILRLSGFRKVRAENRLWPWIIKTEITFGAHRALVLRAADAHCRLSDLLRGMVLDLLHGRLKGLQVVTSASQMWDDETRYWTKVG